MLPVPKCLLPVQRYFDPHPAIEKVNQTSICASICFWWDNALNSFAQLVLTPETSRAKGLLGNEWKLRLLQAVSSYLWQTGASF